MPIVIEEIKKNIFQSVFITAQTAWLHANSHNFSSHSFGKISSFLTTGFVLLDLLTQWLPAEQSLQLLKYFVMYLATFNIYVRPVNWWNWGLHILARNQLSNIFISYLYSLCLYPFSYIILSYDYFSLIFSTECFLTFNFIYFFLHFGIYIRIFGL